MADVQRADEQDYDRRVGRGPVTPYAKRACELSLPDSAGVDATADTTERAMHRIGGQPLASKSPQISRCRNKRQRVKTDIGGLWLQI